MVDYEFCVTTPNWPDCDRIIKEYEDAQKQQEQADGGMDGEHGMDGMDMDRADPMMGQMAYTLTAVLTAANAGLTLFRYSKKGRNDVSAYDNVWGGQNWIDIYRMIYNYSELAFFGVASITQIATLFGAMASTNLMVWMYGSMFMALAGLMIEVLMWYARDGASTSSDAEADNAFAQVENDAVWFAAFSAVRSFNLYTERRNWMAAQWMLLSDEEKDMWMKERRGDDDDKEMPESLFSLMF